MLERDEEELLSQGFSPLTHSCSRGATPGYSAASSGQLVGFRRRWEIVLRQRFIANELAFGELVATVRKVRCTSPESQCLGGRRVHNQCHNGKKNDDKKIGCRMHVERNICFRKSYVQSVKRS